MLTITDGGTLSLALSTSINPRLKQLLTDRIRQLDVDDLSTAARFMIVQVGDTTHDLERALGFTILQNVADGTRYGNTEFSPSFEWLEDHGHTYELVFIFTDDGFAHVVLVPNDPSVDPTLLSFCRTYADEQLTT